MDHTQLPTSLILPPETEEKDFEQLIKESLPDYLKDSSVGPEDMRYMVKLMEELLLRYDYSGTKKWFVPGSPYSIEHCPKHRLFFDASKYYRQTAFIAGNRCLAAGTLVATPKGPVEIEHIAAGDYVYDRYGQPTKVIQVWDNGYREVGSLTNRGKVFGFCTPDHELDAVQISKHSFKWDLSKNKELRLRADELTETTLVRRTYVKSPLGSVSYPNAYVLGALLGDGCGTCGSSRTVTISSADEKIPKKIAGILDVPFSDVRKYKGNYSWGIPWEGDSLYDSWARDKLAHEKIVDIKEVHTWNRETALNFVAGLLDTDGSLSKGKDGFCLSFSNQSRSMVDAFSYLVLALWNEPTTLAVDRRSKYKNGPVFSAVMRNPHAIKRIAEELHSYVAHKYKLDIQGIESIGKRSRPEAIKLRFSGSVITKTYDLTVEHPEHFFLLANGISVSNCGKTIAGAYATSCHLTGIYPDWWEGRRFEEPVRWWAAGQTGQTTRDTVQYELMGTPSSIGTGMIPANCIVATSARAGTPHAFDTVRVKHISGGVSTLGFKSFDQEIKAYYGTAMDGIWLDEECPELILNECLMRTMTTNGILFITFTPLHGITSLIANFDSEADHLGDARPILAKS